MAKEIIYVTERCVFELKPEGLTLTEIAPGVDLGKDIIGQMEFVPRISETLKMMDRKLFTGERLGLRERMNLMP